MVAPGNVLLLQIQGLTLANDRRKCVRPLALDIATLRIDRRERIFVLGERSSGKSALEDAVLAIMKTDATEGTNLDFPNREGQTQPIHVARLFRAIGASGRKQGGTTEAEIAALRRVAAEPDPSSVLNYADDPCRGTEVINIAFQRNLTLMISNDPERPAKSLGFFLEKPAGRVLWLCEGTVFWSGPADEFVNHATSLMQQYVRRRPTAGEQFLDAIRQATTVTS